MNTDSIKNRFAQVFENDYQGYDYFIENVVNPIFTGDDAYEPLPVPEEFLTDEKRQRANESGILSILKVGTVDAEEPVDLYDITLSDRKELQYNRVGIQQFIRSELFSFTNAFMLFHNETPEGKDWRFSYAYKETTQKSMTSAKRYTYLFGKNHRARTASERFAKLAGEDKNTQNLLNAFSVEALSKDFFNEYKNQYNLFCKFISEHKNNPEFFGSKMAYWEDKSLRDYVKKMMGRITFIYFLQRKGWINGDMQYMQNAFQKSPHQDDYLDMFLEPLFFGVLNTKPKDRKTLFEKEGWDLSLLKEWKDVPYLNGGLFERDEHDQPKSKFPAEMFKNLFDFYARYNFTIDENDPDDAEVGVDPEMLGHIFENLLEDNKDKGAFYTPKEIVQYMCRESLIAYLTNCAEENTGHKYPHEQTEASVRMLVQTPEQIVPKMSHRQKEDFGKALREVKICDPAIGSGAFPMGLLNELVRLRISIGAWADKANDIAALKREIIQNNIYGVDIEKGAVDIARLRFWLSLVVDEIEPEPLPNLDYKIMCGNSLIHRFALDVSFKDVFSDYNKQHKTKYTLEDYKKWVADYLNTTDHTKKEDFRKRIEEVKFSFRSELTKKEVSKEQKLKKKINDIETANLFGLDQEQKKQILELKKQLTDLEKKHQDIVNNVVYENAFEWRFEFPALLDDDGNFMGFDIVIGNPPYGAKTSNSDKEYYKQKYYCTTSHPKQCLKGSTDTFAVFIELGHSVLCQSGNLAFIVPMSVGSSDAMTSLQSIIESTCSEIRVSSYSNRPKQIFDAACVRTSIFMFQKSEKPLNHIYTTKLNRRTESISIKNIIDDLQFVDSKKLKILGRYAKIGTQTELQVLSDLFKFNNKIKDYISETGKEVFYRAAGGRYFNVVTNYPTFSSAEKSFKCKYTDIIGLVLSSSYFYFYQQVYTDGLNLKWSEIENYPLPDLTKLSKKTLTELSNLYSRYLIDIEKNATVRQSSSTSTHNIDSFKEYKIVRSKKIISEIDDVVGQLYNFSKDEIDFIKNYEIKFRLAGE